MVDAFVCSEVLEHIENPLLFLQKISDIVHKNSFIYLTTAINAPSSGHIYLFRSKEEVLNLVVQAGLNVKNYICVDNSGNNIKIKDYKKPILIGMVLEKNI